MIKAIGVTDMPIQPFKDLPIWARLQFAKKIEDDHIAFPGQNFIIVSRGFQRLDDQIWVLYAEYWDEEVMINFQTRLVK